MTSLTGKAETSRSSRLERLYFRPSLIVAETSKCFLRTCSLDPDDRATVRSIRYCLIGYDDVDIIIIGKKPTSDVSQSPISIGSLNTDLAA